jgi:hypothetical protein
LILREALEKMAAEKAKEGESVAQLGAATTSATTSSTTTLTK